MPASACKTTLSLQLRVLGFSLLQDKDVVGRDSGRFNSTKKYWAGAFGWAWACARVEPATTRRLSKSTLLGIVLLTREEQNTGKAQTCAKGMLQQQRLAVPPVSSRRVESQWSWSWS